MGCFFDSSFLDLEIINNIKFSLREVDIVSCIVNGRSPKFIAHLLDISPKTVEAHIRNIKIKMNCSSKEQMVSFIEKSNKYQLISQHYRDLIVNVEFEKSLQNISSEIANKSIELLTICLIKNDNEEDIKCCKLIKHLFMAGIKANLEYKNLNNLDLQANNYVLLCSAQAAQEICNRYKGQIRNIVFFTDGPSDIEQKSQIISSANPNNYYSAVLELISRFYSNEQIESLISKFRSFYEGNSSDFYINNQIAEDKTLVNVGNCVGIIDKRKTKYIVAASVALVSLIYYFFYVNKSSESSKNVSTNSQYSYEYHTVREATHNLPELNDDLKNNFVDSSRLNSNLSYMQELERTFSKKNGGINSPVRRKVVLGGMGGIGKSTLALMYAYRKIQNYDYIFWISGNNDENLLGSYKKLLKKLHVVYKESEELRGILEKVEDSLSDKKFLLVYDDVPTNFFLEGKIPTGNEGYILITSRCQSWSSPVIIMDVFQPPEAVNFLFTSTNIDRNQKSIEEAEELAKQLEGLPLALSHASAYIKYKRHSSNYTFGNYINDFNNISSELLKKNHYSENSSIDYDYLIGKTLKISRALMSKICNRILDYCAFLDHNHIMVEFFDDFIKEEQKKTKERQVFDPLSDLVKFSLLRRVSYGNFSVHSIAQKVLVNESTKKESIMRISNALSKKVKGLYITDYNSYEKILNYLLNVSALIEASKSLDAKFEGYDTLELSEKVLYYMIVKSGINFNEYFKYANNKDYANLLKKMLAFKNETPSETTKWLREAANQGFVDAMSKLGARYLLKEGEVIKNYAKAKELFQKAADKGSVSAVANMGFLYMYGLGVPQDYTKAMELFQKAANKGDAMAMRHIGMLYRYGLGISQDYAEAIKYFRKAVNKGNAGAMNSLGWLHVLGLGVPQDYTKAMELFQKAAYKEEAYAICNIGLLYMHGLGVPQDYIKARKYFKRAVAQGLAEAINNTGFLYMYGLGVPQDYAKARKYYENAAKKHDCRGYLFLGKDFLKKNRPEKAKEYFKFILDSPENNDDSSYWYALGCVYWNGYNVVEKNVQKALECFEKAYKINPYDPDLQYDFASFLESFPEKIYTARAKKLYQKAGRFIPEARSRLNNFCVQKK